MSENVDKIARGTKSFLIVFCAGVFVGAILYLAAIGAVTAGKALGSYMARENARQSRLHAKQSFYKMCSRRFQVGVVTPGCPR